MTKGILYIAFANKTKHQHEKAFYIKEAIFSARSIKKLHPSLNITLITDLKVDVPCFDRVIMNNLNSIRVKQDLLMSTPYDRTLYLDSDTGIVGPINQIFDLLDRFDIAATHDLIRKDNKKSVIYPEYAEIPDAFSELGGGVILYKNNERVDSFFAAWRKNYRRWCELSGKNNDQPSFRVSLWECKDLKLYILPPEYNIRTKKYHNIQDRIYHHHSMFEKGVVK